MIKTYYKTDKPICYYGTDKPITIPDTFQPKPIKALWVSNVVNIDLPVIQGNGEEYINHIHTLLDTCERFAINTLFFQVRTTNDAFYVSKRNPISRFLTGEEGKQPPFDVFKWVIDEAHKRDITVHGWCNPYRISANGNLSIAEYLDTCDDLNFAKQHPKTIILDDKGKLILNPADPLVKEHIIDSMVELAEIYDVDGIHFDDYFYPYGELSEQYNDLAMYEQHKHQEEELDAFRRRQVNEIIQGVNDALKTIDKPCLFSVSPFGIWKNKASDPNGSNTAPACGQSYYMQYADSVHWVKAGYVDAIVPQIYWPFGHKVAPFADILEFWVDVVKGTNVELYIGHGAYRLGREGEWLNPHEVTDQMKYANQYKEVQGNVFFTYHNFIDNKEAKDGIEQLRQLLLKV